MLLLFLVLSPILLEEVEKKAEGIVHERPPAEVFTLGRATHRALLYIVCI